MGRTHAFTLVELLVVIAIITLLLAILLPALGNARQSAEAVNCASHLRQVGIGIHTYANDHRRSIPFGPEAPAQTATNFYTTTGMVTSLLSLESGDPVGLGLLANRYLAHRPETLFCPGNDQTFDSELQLLNVGITQAQSTYWYRHGSVGPNGKVDPDRLRLDHLGVNSKDQPIRALVMDGNIIAPRGLASYGVITLTNHRAEQVNVLNFDGSASRHANDDGRYTAEVTVGSPHLTPWKMLAAFELADGEF